MEQKQIRELSMIAAKGRILGLDMVYRAASGHIGGSLSCMDILTMLYNGVLRVDPKNPRDPDRDRFVLSKGHCTPALYPRWPCGATSRWRIWSCSAVWTATCPAMRR